MPDIQPFAGISQEESTSMMLLLLHRLLDNLPMRNPTNDTMPVSGTVTANPASGTITTVTTVATVSTLTNMSQIGAAPANTTVADLMNAAAAPLYDLMVIS